jgi:1-carboxybiuret hydrolase subunit AtzG-like protein
MSRKPLKRKTKSVRRAKPTVKPSRSRKPAALHARKAKPAPRAKPSAKPSPKSSAKPSRSQKSNDLTALAAVGIKMLDLPVEPAWHAVIIFNLQLLFKHAAFVDAFALADETEPGPVFRA